MNPTTNTNVSVYGAMQGLGGPEEDRGDRRTPSGGASSGAAVSTLGEQNRRTPVSVWGGSRRVLPVEQSTLLGAG